MTLLKLENINKSYHNNHLLQEISLEIRKGEIIGLIGSNGTGKTSLFNIISGFVKPDAGIISFDSQRVDKLNTQERSAKGIGRLFQNPRVFTKQNPIENLIAAAQNHPGEKWFNYILNYGTIKQYDKEKKQEAEYILERVGLISKRNMLVEELSYGQQKLLSFGMLMMNQPKLILLDEFFAGVSMPMIEQMSLILLEQKNQNRSILMIDHNRKSLKAICDGIYELSNGRLFSKPKTVDVITK